MFTGIVSHKGIVKSRVKSLSTDSSKTTDHLVLDIEADLPEISSGESIAVNGVCLTAVPPMQIGKVSFFVSPETLNKTNLGELQTGSQVNLERALTLQTLISGHLVQGHVDGIGKIASLESDEKSHRIQIQLNSDLTRYCVVKGSITVNGVSLTINTLDLKTHIIEITLIPHTWDQTNLSLLKSGDAVNIEVDVLAKYVERLCKI